MKLRALIGMLGLTILTGCSPKSDSTRSTMDSLATHDSGYTKFENDISELKKKVGIVDDDSIMFAGPVGKFENNNELYTDLFFKDNYDQNQYDFLVKSVDSLVYQGDEVKRSSLPLPIAEEYFDLGAIFTIGVYDSSNHFLGTAELVRVEYLEEIIEAGFVAVFSIDNELRGEPAYCRSYINRLESIADFGYTSRKSKSIDPNILKQLNGPASGDVNVIELTLMPSNEIYKIISKDTSSFIYEKQGQRFLYKSQRSENIIGIIPIELKINDKPLLIVSFAVPETDIFWTSILKFNGQQYEVCPRNRF